MPVRSLRSDSHSRLAHAPFLVNERLQRAFYLKRVRRTKGLEVKKLIATPDRCLRGYSDNASISYVNGRALGVLKKNAPVQTLN